MMNVSLFFMQRARSFYGLLNILSIDIAVGALCCALFFSDVLEVSIRISGIVALTLTVWIIYTADHLRDARVIGEHATSARHRFHFIHRKALLICLCLATIVDGVVILFMRTPVLYFGLYLFVLVALYLLTQKYLKAFKEIFISILYTCGVLLPSIAVTSVSLDTAHYLLFFQLTIVALVNLVLFSWFDHDQDVMEGQYSFVTASGTRAASALIYIISLLHVAVLVWQILKSEFTAASIVLVVMNAILIVIFKAYRKGDKDLFRWAGDAVFFIPGIFWVWQRL